MQYLANMPPMVPAGRFLMVVPLNVFVWQTGFYWHSDRNGLEGTSGIIHQTEFNRDVMFQRYTSATTLIFSCIPSCSSDR